MGASSVKSGFATIFNRSGSAIAEVVSIQGPGITRDAIDVTHLTSDDGVKEYIGGLVDGGTVTLMLNFLPGNSGQKSLFNDLFSGTHITYEIEWSGVGANAWEFDGLVTGVNPSAAKDKQAECSVTIQVSGKPTLPA